MANRTQIVCLCEGKKDSVDKQFISALLKTLRPAWVRPWKSGIVRIEPCGGWSGVIERTPEELKLCLKMGGHTTLMVWADCDHNRADCDALKEKFWRKAQQSGISQEDFDRIVFIFPKDRIENWIQFLNTGWTNEAEEGPRIKHPRETADAAKKLAAYCETRRPMKNMPLSLQWSCKNWQAFDGRMKTA